MKKRNELVVRLLSSKTGHKVVLGAATAVVGTGLALGAGSVNAYADDDVPAEATEAVVENSGSDDQDAYQVAEAVVAAPAATVEAAPQAEAPAAEEPEAEEPAAEEPEAEEPEAEEAPEETADEDDEPESNDIVPLDAEEEDSEAESLNEDCDYTPVGEGTEEENVSGGDSITYTDSDVEQDLADDANGAVVTDSDKLNGTEIIGIEKTSGSSFETSVLLTEEGETLGDGTYDVTDPTATYTVTATGEEVTGLVTFGVVNPKDYNRTITYNMEKTTYDDDTAYNYVGPTGQYYFRYATVDGSENVYVQLVNKVTDAVIETLELKPGDTDVKFTSLAEPTEFYQWYYATLRGVSKDKNYNTPTTPYFNYVLSDESGTTTGSVSFSWTNGRGNYYHSTLIYNVNGGETTGTDYTDGRSNLILLTPTDSSVYTHYVAISSKGKTDEELNTIKDSEGNVDKDAQNAAVDYEENGSEKELAEYELPGKTGQDYTTSDIRDFDNYEYYDGQNNSGTLANDYEEGTRYIGASNPDVNYS